MTDILQLTPATINYTLYRGATFWRKVQVNLDGDAFPFLDGNGALVYSARMQIRKTKPAGAALIDIGTDNITPDPMTGIEIHQEDVDGTETSWLEYLIDADDTEALAVNGPATLYYDVIITNLVTGQVTRLQEGTITLSVGVTRED